MDCRHCGSSATIGNGKSGGVQRFYCRSCHRYCRERAPKFSREVKALALDMHLNNVGIRKIARFTGAAPSTIIAWVRKAHEAMTDKPAAPSLDDTVPDIIEMDEIYTFVQKNSSGPSCGRPTAGVEAGSSLISSPTRA